MPRFRDFELAPAVLDALEAIGYESPSPIQARTIPLLLAGRDVVGQAQTGTGKTAAFALPILSRLDLDRMAPQALVLAPTRELAIQVAEAFRKYAGRLPGFHVLPIYGGQSFEPQLKGLRRGVHVVVGTPGRVVDLVRRGALKLDAIAHVVLDEADEMLRMGFIDDVEWVLQQVPPERRIALFSATMPSAIRRVAQTYLRDPAEVTIKSKTTTGANIRQRYWMVGGMHKLDALTRFLEVEPFDAMLVFVRTKAATAELAERLEARGFAAEALNGDLQQAQRERIVVRLKDGGLDIVVATDVAARGLDVERISHVVNYDIPTDTESYVHRVGRTGRAGRSGEAILFVAPRERHLLKAIERATRQPIEEILPPSAEAINARRVERFKQSVAQAMAQGQGDPAAQAQLQSLRQVILQFEQESGAPLADIAAALAMMAQGKQPLLRPADAASAAVPPAPHGAHKPAAAAGVPPHQPRKPRAPDTPGEPPGRKREAKAERLAEDELEMYRIEVGEQHGAKPANIVGAIANEAGLDSGHIGRIEIFGDYSLVALPIGMPKPIFQHLRKTWVCGRQLQLSLVTPHPKKQKPR
ncbi:MAG: DEAD/DEAH box helicase [Nevskia sp.]|nr:DEAD/DEAH box helicase [Nevskia sp.]